MKSDFGFILLFKKKFIFRLLISRNKENQQLCFLKQDSGSYFVDLLMESRSSNWVLFRLLQGFLMKKLVEVFVYFVWDDLRYVNDGTHKLKETGSGDGIKRIVITCIPLNSNSVQFDFIFPKRFNWYLWWVNCFGCQNNGSKSFLILYPDLPNTERRKKIISRKIIRNMVDEYKKCLSVGVSILLYHKKLMNR